MHIRKAMTWLAGFTTYVTVAAWADNGAQLPSPSPTSKTAGTQAPAPLVRRHYGVPYRPAGQDAKAHRIALAFHLISFDVNY